MKKSDVSESPDWQGIFKESFLTAFVGLILCIPLITIYTEYAQGSLVLKTRYTVTIASILVLFVGRFCLSLLRDGFYVKPIFAGATIFFIALFTELLHFSFLNDYHILRPLFLMSSAVVVLNALSHFYKEHKRTTSEEIDKKWDHYGEVLQQFAKWAAPLVLILVVIFPFTDLASRRLLDFAVIVMTYIMLGWGLNIIVGLAGLLDLGYVAFYAVGAYSFALFAQYYDFGFWTCLPFAGLLACLSGMILGFPVLRLRGDYFAIVTLGFGEIIRVVLINWYQFTGGPNGISGIPKPTFFGLPLKRNAPEGVETFHSYFNLEYSTTDKVIFLYFIILALALAVNFFTLRVRKLPIGRAWEALREDDIAARSLGINLRNTKLAAFMMSATFGGFAGAFFATRQGFISPESFTFLESAIILAIVVLGGFGSQLGVVIATLVLIGLPEIFRELEQFRMFAFGAGMVLIMIWRPKGLLAHREPTVRLLPKKLKMKKS